MPKKSRKVLMMMKAAKLEQGRNRAGPRAGPGRAEAGQGREQGRSRNWAGVG